MPGARVRVPFGGGQRVGIVVPGPVSKPESRHKIKHIIEILDADTLLDDTLLSLLIWASEYYHHPIGECLLSAFPVRMRKALGTPPPTDQHYRLAVNASDALSALGANATRQRRIVEMLCSDPAVGSSLENLKSTLGNCHDALRRLVQKQTIESFTPGQNRVVQSGPVLNSDQQKAVETLTRETNRFSCHLLRGVTGSGKTEVYLEATRFLMEQNRQVLMLVPEISLTPQLVSRFEQRLNTPLAVMHSGLSDGERHRAWLNAASETAAVVLGTRSAVFSQIPRLGLILIDEEHDASYKQQEGFHYHARDVAIKRAALLGIPVLLGSATPSLESYYNARRGRFNLLELPARAGLASLPDVQLVDTRRWPLQDGFSTPLIKALRQRLERGEQSLVFINRRGYAPVMMCGACGWQAHCSRCDALLTLHHGNKSNLQCHHCGDRRAAPAKCPKCGSAELFHAGVGTQRVEQSLRDQFPHARILRIDRDNSSARGALERKLDQVRRHEIDILVGTQLLSKGHDFPTITLVCVLNGDQGMYSMDFRASERLFQSVIQVGGRAGRGQRRGSVLIQTAFVDHPCMAAIQQHDFESFADNELELREQGQFPPFSHIALLRAESVHSDSALQFLHLCATLGEEIVGDSLAVEVMDPVPAPMERRAGRFRAQLLLQSRSRGILRAFIDQLIETIDGHTSARKVRWSIDIDPIDLY